MLMNAGNFCSVAARRFSRRHLILDELPLWGPCRGWAVVPKPVERFPHHTSSQLAKFVFHIPHLHTKASNTLLRYRAGLVLLRDHLAYGQYLGFLV